MADRNLRLPNNADGKYYVDNSCTDCDLCRQIAPDMFVRDDIEAYTFVIRQPVGPDENANALEAAESCPSDSIGIDGEE